MSRIYRFILGSLANILSDIKKGLIQDSQYLVFLPVIFQTISVDNQLKSDLSVCLSSLMEIMSYLHFDYWKKTARSGASMNKENK